MTNSPDIRSLARVVLSTAAEIEAAERQIREDIAEAAIRGDLDGVLSVIDRWAKLPTVQAVLENRRDSA